MDAIPFVLAMFYWTMRKPLALIFIVLVGAYILLVYRKDEKAERKVAGLAAITLGITFFAWIIFALVMTKGQPFGH